MGLKGIVSELVVRGNEGAGGHDVWLPTCCCTEEGKDLAVCYSRKIGDGLQEGAREVDR